MALQNELYSSPESYDRAAQAKLDKSCEIFVKTVDREIEAHAETNMDKDVQTFDVTVTTSAITEVLADRIVENYTRRGWPSVTYVIGDTDTIFTFVKDPDYTPPE